MCGVLMLVASSNNINSCLHSRLHNRPSHSAGAPGPTCSRLTSSFLLPDTGARRAASSARSSRTPMRVTPTASPLASTTCPTQREGV